MSDFMPLYNYKFVNEIDWGIPKILGSNNFVIASVLCWWAEWRYDIIFGVKSGSLVSQLLPSILYLGSQRLFFKIISVVGNSALSSGLFQKSSNYVVPKSETFLTNLIIFIKNDCFIVDSSNIVGVKWINYTFFFFFFHLRDAFYTEILL